MEFIYETSLMGLSRSYVMNKEDDTQYFSFELYGLAKNLCPVHVGNHTECSHETAQIGLCHKQGRQRSLF